MRKLLLAPLAIAYTLRQQKNRTRSAPRLNHFFQRVCRHARQRSPAMRMGVLGPPHAIGMHMAYTAVITSILFLASIATVGVALAAASNPDVIVEHVTDLGVFKGRHYVQVEGLMVATFTREDGSTGHYRAPLIMRFPVGGRPGNGVGVVDVPNTAKFGFPTPRPLTIDDILQFGESTVGDFLLDEGFTYISVMWAKQVVDFFGAGPPAGQRRGLGYGTIERGAPQLEDQIRIHQDTARLLRNPPSFGDQVETPEPVEQVLAFGYSQTANRLVVQLIRAPNNFEVDGSLLFDGFILGGTTSSDGTGTLYPQDRGKIIAVYSETDLMGNRAALDRVSAGLSVYRQYEMPGVAHLPKPIAPWTSEYGAFRQNPADFSPVYRAVVSHLTDWIREGEEPPPSLFMDGTIETNGNLIPARDADGNALAGLRLPHMPSLVCTNGNHCHAAGAPLGTYTGAETTIPGTFPLLAGTFEPFSPEELKERYGNRGIYVQLVRRAAQDLRKQGYILQEDYRRYVREAAHQPLW